ncbi:hypothetical protein ACVGW3_10090, partial [Enterobacter hormaechei]
IRGADWAMNPLRSSAHVYENGKAWERGRTKSEHSFLCFVLAFSFGHLWVIKRPLNPHHHLVFVMAVSYKNLRAHDTTICIA